MKTTLARLLSLSGLAALLGAGFLDFPVEAQTPDQPADPAEQPAQPAPIPELPQEFPAPPPIEDSPIEPPFEAQPLGEGDPKAPEGQRDPARPASEEPRLPIPPAQSMTEIPVQKVRPGEKGLRMNFRGVPLEMVLNYLSDAAGFVINLETEVRGKVDVWSNQPLDQEEAVELLSTVLSRNGYAALRNGRTLTIVSREDAKKRDIPVVSGNIPDKIPKSEEIVTQIIPVQYISATQLTKDLQALLPSTATMTANEGGNALVITDSQVNIRRMAEIIRALDQAISAVSKVQVFPLKFADAKNLATTIQNLFQSQDSRGNQSGPGRIFAAFQGRGGPGGGSPDGASPGSGRAPTPRVIALADEYSNAVVVSAPTEQMTVIEEVILQIDRDVEEITELRVFHLKHADPQETADLLANLFSTTSGTQSQRAQQFRFGGPGGFGGQRGGGNSTGDSIRSQQQNRVTAVADPRTGSVVVSTSKELMEQIARMIEQLDSDPARKQKVFVYSVENTDPEAMQTILQNLFPEQSNSNQRNRSSTQRQNSNQLNNRTTQNNNQGNRNTGNSGFGGTSFGGNQGR